MTASLYSLAFLLGLLSTLHCWGMCGGLLLAFSPPQKPADHGWITTCRHLSYSLGRVTSYTVAGALSGGFAEFALRIMAPAWGHQGLQILAASILILSGLSLLHLLPGLARFQSMGLALWRRLQPLSRRLLPADRLSKRFLLGMIWGWLPCGFVYSMLALAAAQGTPASGALLMSAFGLGTLPGMLTAQRGIQTLRQRLTQLPAPALGAWLLICSGVVLLYLLSPWSESGLQAHHAQVNHAIESVTLDSAQRLSGIPLP